MQSKQQQLYRRLIGSFLIFYAFLMSSLPTQYGFGLPNNVARVAGIGLALIGIYLDVKS